MSSSLTRQDTQRDPGHEIVTSFIITSTLCNCGKHWKEKIICGRLEKTKDDQGKHARWVKTKEDQGRLVDNGEKDSTREEDQGETKEHQ